MLKVLRVELVRASYRWGLRVTWDQQQTYIKVGIERHY